MLVDLDHPEDGHGATYEDGTPVPACAFQELTGTAMVFYLFGLSNGTFVTLAECREQRCAATAQWKALIARDRGCIRCGAKPKPTTSSAGATAAKRTYRISTCSAAPVIPPCTTAIAPSP